MSVSPTPWRLHADGDIIAANQVLVAIVPCKEDRAVIAAAPEMLECLRMVLQRGRIDDSESRMIQVATAISKAEGYP